MNVKEEKHDYRLERMGILIIPIVGMCIYLMYTFSTLLVSDSPNSLVPGVMISLGCVLAAIPLWLLGKYLKKRGPLHTLFFIPMHYWAPIVAALGIVGLAQLFSSDGACGEEMN